jgi:hypothetical protein
MTAKGVDLRRLDPSSAPPAEIPAAGSDSYPLLPRTSPPIVPAPAVAAVSASHPYRLGDSPTLRPFVNFSLGPDGNAVQLGLDGDDVLGRLHGLAAGSIGDAAGPRGGTVAAAYRGLPVDLVAQLFSAIEKPGRQSLIERPAFDEERLGGYVGAVWSRVLPAGRVRLEAGGGGTDVHAFSEGRHFGRVLGSFAGELAWRRTRGRSGFALAADAAGSVGATDGSSWQQLAGGLRLSGILPWATLSGTARLGDTYGTPSRFDAFTIGGAPSTILPPGLDRNHIESRLPATCRSASASRPTARSCPPPSCRSCSTASGSAPGTTASPEPDFVRVAGGELRLERLVPAEFGRTLTCVWASRAFSARRRGSGRRAYATFIYRP